MSQQKKTRLWSSLKDESDADPSLQTRFGTGDKELAAHKGGGSRTGSWSICRLTAVVLID